MYQKKNLKSTKSEIFKNSKFTTKSASNVPNKNDDEVAVFPMLDAYTQSLKPTW